MVSNTILAFFCRLLSFYNSLYRGMHIKATIVAYTFSVQCFENATIMAYAGLRVKHNLRELWMIISLKMFKIFSHTYRINH